MDLQVSSSRSMHAFVGGYFGLYKIVNREHRIELSVSSNIVRKVEWQPWLAAYLLLDPRSRLCTGTFSTRSRRTIVPSPKQSRVTRWKRGEFRIEAAITSPGYEKLKCAVASFNKSQDSSEYALKRADGVFCENGAPFK